VTRLSVLACTALAVSLSILGSSLTSCHFSGPVDRSLLTGEPCQPPCWQGLVPGVSTEQEVENLIAVSEYVNPHRVYRERSGGATIISWESAVWSIARAQPNAFILDGDTLMVITHELDYELTLEDLLARYGPPQKFWVRWRGWGTADVLVNLYYPAMGLVLELVLEPSDGYHELQPQNQVMRVWYCPGTSLEGFLDLGESIPFPPEEYMETDLHDWGGYGTVKPY